MHAWGFVGHRDVEARGSWIKGSRTLTVGGSVGEWSRARRPDFGDLAASSTVISGLILAVVAPRIETLAEDRHIHGHVSNSQVV